MNIICIQEEAFYALIDQVVQYVRTTQPDKEDRWISGEEAMQMLRITSKTTLQKFRDDGSIRFSQPAKKVILYDRESISKFLDKHARDTF